MKATANTREGATQENNINLLPKMANAPKWLKYAAFSLMMTLGGSAMQSCEKDEVDPIAVDVSPYAGLSGEALTQKLHQDAEAYANSQGWSQGVRSLAAGVIDYHYYYPNETAAKLKQPLILLSYQVDVADFISKIETDAKNRGTYDPKTEGVFQATVASLEGDNANNVWFVPSGAIYEAKALGKTNISLDLGTYPSPNPGRNTITSGVIPDKKMQIYSNYGKLKTDDVNKDRILDFEKKGAIKDIL